MSSTGLQQAEAQPWSDTIQARLYRVKADSLFNEEQYAVANESFRKALSIYENHELWAPLVHCLNKLCVGYRQLSAYDSAEEIGQRALKLGENKLGKQHLKTGEAYNNLGELNDELGHFNMAIAQLSQALEIRKSLTGEKSEVVADTYNSMGVAYYYAGYLNEALFYYQKALEIRQRILPEYDGDIGTTLNNLGLVYLDKGYYQKALEYFTKYLKILKRGSSASPVNTSIVYNNIGNVYVMDGQYELALDYFTNSLNIRKKQFGEDHRLTANAYSNIGVVHDYLQKYDLALKYFNKVINIDTQLFGQDHLQISYIYNNIGNIYLDQEQYELARSFYEKSLTISRRYFEENSIEIALLYDNIGLVYLEQNKYDQALALFKKSLKILSQIHEDTHPQIAMVHHNIGRVHTTKSNYINGLRHFQQALIANITSYNDTSIYSFPVLENYLDEKELLTTLKLKAQAFISLYMQKSSEKDLITGLKSYRLADKLIQKMRNSILNFEDRVALAKDALAIYENAIETCLLWYDKTGKKKYLVEAFEFSEKSKSGALKLALSELSAKRSGHLPQDLIDLETALKADRAYYKTALMHEKSMGSYYDTVKISLYETKLFAINRTFDSLMLALEKQYPNYYDLKYRENYISMDQLQNNLPKGSALIEYFLGDSSSYAFVVTKGQLNAIPLAKPMVIKEQVEGLKMAMNIKKTMHDEDQSYQLYVKYARSLYQEILENVLAMITPNENIKRLTIIPDGSLGYIPFDILLSDDLETSSLSYAHLPYLIKDYRVSYGYSATLLYNHYPSAISGVANKDYIAFAPSYDPRLSDSLQRSKSGRFSNMLLPLKWNAQEVNSISHYLNGQVHLGDQAVERTFKSMASGHSIIHLAMHALIDDQRPMNSKLVFTQQLDSLEDGFLNAYELYNMELSADLAILSACNTGSGKLARGEGIMSLARAFSYAGCPSVIMSHWNADDESTALLIESFYKYLAEGSMKDEALQKARLDYLQNASPAKTSPLYWGSFVLVGDTAAVVEGDNSKYWWILAFIAACTGLFVLSRYKASTGVRRKKGKWKKCRIDES